MKKTILIAGLVVLGLLLLPSVRWGKIEWGQPETVTVTGEARSQQTNQIATFTAGVNVTNDNKDQAVKEVNQRVEAIIASVKQFGIKAEDIKTQNINIYQEDQEYIDKGVRKYRPGQWRVGNNIEIVLREVSKAAQLADLLASSGATTMFGPNFTFDNTNQAERELFGEAMEDAKEKAESLAKLAGRRLGKVINVNEGGGGMDFRPMAVKEGMGGAGVPVEPGSTTVSKTLTVVYELR
ncbi:MAG: SIMPL domain-containing protein [Candidatus Shapirobacteria bacterium]|jgi:hypothetical protein